jgi:hypothetical protein
MVTAALVLDDPGTGRGEQAACVDAHLHNLDSSISIAVKHSPEVT